MWASLKKRLIIGTEANTFMHLEEAKGKRMTAIDK